MLLKAISNLFCQDATAVLNPGLVYLNNNSSGSNNSTHTRSPASIGVLVYQDDQNFTL